MTNIIDSARARLEKMERFSELIKGGATLLAASRDVGISQHIATRWAKSLGWKKSDRIMLGTNRDGLSQAERRANADAKRAAMLIAREDGRSMQMTRAEKMYQSYKDGRTVREIGDEWGVTRERVRQILTGQFGTTFADSGIHKLLMQRKEQRRNNVAKYIANKFGCSPEQLAEMRRMRVVYEYKIKRRNVIRPGGSWELNLYQFWTLWRDSDHWEQRGIGVGKYVMATIDKTKNYRIGNIEIVRYEDAIVRRYKVREPRAPKVSKAIDPRVLPTIPEVGTRGDLCRAVVSLKGQMTAREIMQAYGLVSRNVVIGIWNRAKRASA